MEYPLVIIKIKEVIFKFLSNLIFINKVIYLMKKKQVPIIFLSFCVVDLWARPLLLIRTSTATMLTGPLPRVRRRHLFALSLPPDRNPTVDNARGGSQDRPPTWLPPPTAAHSSTRVDLVGRWMTY